MARRASMITFLSLALLASSALAAPGTSSGQTEDLIKRDAAPAPAPAPALDALTASVEARSAQDDDIDAENYADYLGRRDAEAEALPLAEAEAQPEAQFGGPGRGRGRGGGPGGRGPPGRGPPGHRRNRKQRKHRGPPGMKGGPQGQRGPPGHGRSQMINRREAQPQSTSSDSTGGCDFSAFKKHMGSWEHGGRQRGGGGDEQGGERHGPGGPGGQRGRSGQQKEKRNPSAEPIAMPAALAEAFAQQQGPPGQRGPPGGMKMSKQCWEELGKQFGGQKGRGGGGGGGRGPPGGGQGGPGGGRGPPGGGRGRGGQ